MDFWIGMTMYTDGKHIVYMSVFRYTEPHPQKRVHVRTQTAIAYYTHRTACELHSAGVRVLQPWKKRADEGFPGKTLMVKK